MAAQHAACSDGQVFRISRRASHPQWRHPQQYNTAAGGRLKALRKHRFSHRRQRASRRQSIGTIAASFELRSVSDVFTLRTFGAAVSFSTKAWNVFRSGATHFRMRTLKHVATEMACERHTVGRWRQRYLADGLNGLQDAPRSGRPRRVSPL